MNIIDNEGYNPIVSVAKNDEAATCITMMLEVFKMEIQSGPGNNAENVRKAKRSLSSIGIVSINLYLLPCDFLLIILILFQEFGSPD